MNNTEAAFFLLWLILNGMLYFAVSIIFIVDCFNGDGTFWAYIEVGLYSAYMVSIVDVQGAFLVVLVIFLLYEIINFSYRAHEDDDNKTYISLAIILLQVVPFASFAIINKCRSMYEARYPRALSTQHEDSTNYVTNYEEMEDDNKTISTQA